MTKRRINDTNTHEASTSHTHLSFAPPPLRPVTSTRLYIYSSLSFLISLLSGLLAISYIYCPDNIDFVQPLCHDTHYKYLIPLFIPVTAWFGIANWVGWEYFRFA